MTNNKNTELRNMCNKSSEKYRFESCPDYNRIKIMIWMILGTLFIIWLVLTEGNIFLRDNDDDDDPTHQSIDL